MLLRIFKARCPGAKIVVSALQPPLGAGLARTVMCRLKPDLVLVQAEATERLVQRLSCGTAFLLNGVDTARFSPALADRKKAFRSKYSVAQEKFVVHHVGSIKENRNLLVFREIQAQKDVQVIIVGNTTFAAEGRVCTVLKESGCIIWRTYFENLEEIYRLADCYVFPAIDKSSCIEMPLSVLEAMSCNLPVISTRFGALTRLFPRDGSGLIFAHTAPEMITAIGEVRRGLDVKNRERVTSYSWEGVGKQLQEVYRTLVL